MEHPRIPDRLASAYEGWRWSVVSQYMPEAVTFRLERAGRTARYAKLARSQQLSLVHAEAERTRWAHYHLPVPEVIEEGSDGEVAWLITAGLRGTDATDRALRRDPVGLARLLGTGLRRFHERAPVERCPFDFRLSSAMSIVRRRVALGLVDPVTGLHHEHRFVTAAREALAELEQLLPGSEDTVVCHGDYQLSNVLVASGAVVGYLDLGELGLADRWLDLAVGAWSVSGHLGPGLEDVFYDAYGIIPEERCIAFYRLLHDLAS